MTYVKTQAVADMLQVAPKTIQNWVRKHGVQVNTNDRGHYLYDEQMIEMLKGIKERQMPAQEAFIINQEEKSPTLMASTREAEKKMEDILFRLEHLERMIERKADEVVSFQLLKHRHELDDVQKSMLSLEDQLASFQNDDQSSETKTDEQPVREKRKLGKMFSFSGS
ncbi:hypothetical protein JCM19037_705 [Geomicrobium sp. JCM 19037]|uniref:MerR family transcriptional regulator n=2 Tax=Geomicrobium TaxID=767528 RepID=UPI00045F1269|nr:MerR family transcriptional regulator [Geomicrobium sp. JCM 19037]GAK02470.1 hypothetical protein JCM19037_705 [Geomicrobium sp. JCM 19037]